jgi:hypothetical protein
MDESCYYTLKMQEYEEMILEQTLESIHTFIMTQLIRTTQK